MSDVISIIDLQEFNQESRETFIERLLYAGQTILLIGKQKTGKSYLAEQLSGHLAAGVDWGNGQLGIPKPLGVLYVLTEGTRWDLAERINPLSSFLNGKHLRQLKENWNGWRPNRLDLSSIDGTGMDGLLTRLREFEIEVLFIDSLYSSFSGSTSNEDQISAVSITVGEIKERFPRLSIVILHHEHRERRDQKGEVINEGFESFSGSWVVSAMGDGMWLYTSKGNQAGSYRELAFGNIRSRFQGQTSFRIDLDEKTGLLTAEAKGSTEGLQDFELWFRKVGKASKNQVQAYFTGAKLAQSTMYRYIDTLKKQGRLIEADVNGKPGLVYTPEATRTGDSE